MALIDYSMYINTLPIIGFFFLISISIGYLIAHAHFLYLHI